LQDLATGSSRGCRSPMSKHTGRPCAAPARDRSAFRWRSSSSACSVYCCGGASRQTDAEADDNKERRVISCRAPCGKISAGNATPSDEGDKSSSSDGMSVSDDSRSRPFPSHCQDGEGKGEQPFYNPGRTSQPNTIASCQRQSLRGQRLRDALGDREGFGVRTRCVPSSRSSRVPPFSGNYAASDGLFDRGPAVMIPVSIAAAYDNGAQKQPALAGFERRHPGSARAQNAMGGLCRRRSNWERPPAAPPPHFEEGPGRGPSRAFDEKNRRHPRRRTRKGCRAPVGRARSKDVARFSAARHVGNGYEWTGPLRSRGMRVSS